MVFLDALSAEDGEVVGAVEVLDTLVMSFAQQALDAFFVFEIDVSQDTIAFHNLIQDIEVQWKLVHAFDLLHQFSADGAPHSEVMVQALQALSAEGVSTVNEYPWDSLSNIELFCAIVAKV